MKTKSDLIDEFSGMGDRFAIHLLDGRYYEGYILEIEEDYFEFGQGGPMGAAEDIRISYGEVDFDRLSFIDIEDGRYKDASWDETTGKWVISDSA